MQRFVSLELRAFCCSTRRKEEVGENLVKVLAWVTEDAVAGPSAQGHPYAGVVEVC